MPSEFDSFPDPTGHQEPEERLGRNKPAGSGPSGGKKKKVRRHFPWAAWVGAAVVLLVVFCALILGTSPEFWQKNAAPRAFRTVVIDPGHGGYDTGATGNGLREKDLCLDVALQLADLLQAQGLRTVLTRSDDRFIPLSQRARIANREDRAIFVSVHFNETENHFASGIETWQAASKSRAPSELLRSLLPQEDRGSQAVLEDSLAGSLQSEMVASLHMPDRGVKRRNFYVVRNVHAPAVLVEGGFVSNAATARLLKTKEYRRKLATALCRGIIKYRSGWEPVPVLLARSDE